MTDSEDRPFWEQVAEKWGPRSLMLVLCWFPMLLIELEGELLNWLNAPLLAGWNLAWYTLGPIYLVELFLIYPRWRRLREAMGL